MHFTAGLAQQRNKLNWFKIMERSHFIPLAHVTTKIIICLVLPDLSWHRFEIPDHNHENSLLLAKTGMQEGHEVTMRNGMSKQVRQTLKEQLKVK